MVIIGMFNALQKHHWLTILTNKRYTTFREYLIGK